MIQINSVSFSYNGKKVLDDVSLEVESGEFTGLLGPNGAGKSTLLRVISRILTPQSGHVILNGKILGEYALKELARLAAVLPAETFVAYDFSVLEIVKMGRSPHMRFWSSSSELDYAVIRESLERVGIGHLADRSIHSLSSGERQMVFLAQAMVQEPRILLLDEPTVHLDIHHQIEIFQILKKWNEEQGLTVLIISHDLNLASRFCKRLVLMNAGKIAADGAPKEVITPENLEKIYRVPKKLAHDLGFGI